MNVSNQLAFRALPQFYKILATRQEEAQYPTSEKIESCNKIIKICSRIDLEYRVDPFVGVLSSVKISSCVRFMGRFFFESPDLRLRIVFCNISITRVGFMPQVS